MAGNLKLRSQLANAERRLKAQLDDVARRAEVDRLRTEYQTSALADHITKIVDAAPPLSVEQRDRLALLLRGGAEPPGGSAPGTQQHPAERRHRQRDESRELTTQAEQAEAELHAVGGEVA